MTNYSRTREAENLMSDRIIYIQHDTSYTPDTVLGY